MTISVQQLVLRASAANEGGHTGDEQHRQLGPFTVEVAAGEKLLLVGPSGSGKSLLLAVLAGLRPRTVVAGGARVARPLGIVFPRDALEHEASVVNNVMRAGVDRARAAFVLAALGLGDVVDRWPQALSGGQRRRVALARAVAASPRALLLDDPTAGLDPLTASEVLAAIDTLAPDAAVVIASPDVDVVGPRAPRALWLGGVTPVVCASQALPAPFTPRAMPRLVAA